LFLISILVYFVNLYDLPQLSKHFILANAIAEAFQLLWILGKHISHLIDGNAVLRGLHLQVLVYIFGFYFDIIKFFLQLFIQEEPLGIAQGPIVHIFLVLFGVKTGWKLTL